MNRVRREMESFGAMLISDLESFSKGGFESGVSAPVWGTTLRLPELLDMFLTDGKYDVGKGDIIVPPNVDFVHKESPTPGMFRFHITQGNPYFEGRGLVKLLDTLSGTPKIHSVDVNNDCRGGEINITNFVNYPFKLLRGDE